MPQVTALPRKMQDGSVVTQFTDTTSIQMVTYSFPNKQTELSIENSGEASLVISVGNHRNIHIAPDTVWNVSTTFDFFTIYSSTQSQEFTVTATYKTITELNQINDDSPLPIKLEDAGVALPVEIRGTEKEFLFTTAATLGANAVFISPFYDVSISKTISGLVDTNQVGTLYIQESKEQVTWYNTYKLDVTASTSVSISGVTYQNTTPFKADVVSNYVRLIYVNGATAQTRFNLTAYAVSN